MNKENQDLLFGSFPNLYSLRNEDNPVPIKFGIQCDDGWFDILFMLSAALEKINDSYDEGEKIRVIQAKEKFGGLRFYISMNSPEIDNLVYMAQMLSFQICEDCGMKGTLMVDENKKIMRTVCEEHRVNDDLKLSFTKECKPLL